MSGTRFIAGVVVGAVSMALVIALGLRSTGQRIPRLEFILTVILGAAFIGSLVALKATEAGA
jgi:hypothetical protein